MAHTKRTFRHEAVDFSCRFQKQLLCWFDTHKRNLPWRVERDPYRVWISEVMLQQTRVAVVIGYYERFMARFPDIYALARARESAVLAAWSGLGYYRRARAAHAASKMVVRELGGQFPRSSEQLRQLPGVGRYTAAAIASIAFGEACAVVDGNVERVLRRITGLQDLIGEKTWELAQDILSPSRPGDFNEALMELGATVCLPGEPACARCPVYQLCKTLGRGNRAAGSVRLKKQEAYALRRAGRSVYLVKRPKSAPLMPTLWELPKATSPDAEVLFTLRHAITNTDYTVTVVNGNGHQPAGGRWISLTRAADLGLTGLTRKILKKAEAI